MTSIYRRALGAEFERLHPELQRRFGLHSGGGVASIGTGCMEEMWRGPWWSTPFLVLGAWRNIMFPERGSDVPFTVENYPYVDGFGRETVTWVRTFQLPRRPRRFDATMVFSEQRGLVVDYLGNHQHLAVDIHLSVDEEGALLLRSGEQRFYEGPLAFRFPPALSGIAEVREGYDAGRERFTIDVKVSNERFGLLFGYRGWFVAEECELARRRAPAHVRPLREERRE